MHQFLTILMVSLAAFASACSRQEAPARNAPVPGGGVHLVEAAVVRSAPFAAKATRSGSLRAQREIQIQTQEEGRIVALPHYAGDVVRQNDLLLRLDDALLTAELRKVEAQRRQVELDLSRLERLFSNQLVSEDELARARTALDVALADEQLLQTRLGYTRITAPFPGVISARLAEPGDMLPRFSHVLTLTDMRSLVTTTNVSELLLPALSVGDAVEIQIDALGTAVFRGRILRIHPAIDPATRQGVLEVALEPVPAGARPGQLCRVYFTGRPQARRVVPFAALRRDNSGEFVFIVNAEEQAQRREVVSGMQLGEDIELLSGPEVGALVITKGFLGLVPGRKVNNVASPPPSL